MYHLYRCNSATVDGQAELFPGRVDPRVGSGRVGLGRVGSRKLPRTAGRVGSGPDPGGSGRVQVP